MKSLSRYCREHKAFVENRLTIAEGKLSRVMNLEVGEYRQQQREILRMLECLRSVADSGNVVLIQRFEEILSKET